MFVSRLFIAFCSLQSLRARVLYFRDTQISDHDMQCARACAPPAETLNARAGFNFVHTRVRRVELVFELPVRVNFVCV